MTLKSSVAAWLAERETLPNGVTSRYTRGQNIFGVTLCLLVLAILIPLAIFVFFVLGGALGRESGGTLVAHGVKLAILSLF